MRTGENIQKIVIGQDDNYIAHCFFDYPYFKENCKFFVLDLSKLQALDAYSSVL